VGDDPVTQPARGRWNLVGDDVQAGPGSQIRPDLPNPGVEPQTGELGCTVLGVDLKGLAVPAHEALKVGVVDLDASRLLA
jgi:hypothetical protein